MFCPNFSNKIEMFLSIIIRSITFISLYAIVYSHLKVVNGSVLVGRGPSFLVSSRASWLEHRKAPPLERSNSRKDLSDNAIYS